MSLYDQKIKDQALSMGVPVSVIPMIQAQARTETADYTSNVFKNLNNAFGYKYVGQQKWPVGSGSGAPSQDAQGNPDGGNYARYKSVEDSTGELIDWLYRRQRDGYFNVADLTDPDTYAQGLKAAGYYGETWQEYAGDMLVKLKKIATSTGGSITIVLLLVGAFFFNS